MAKKPKPEPKAKSTTKTEPAKKAEVKETQKPKGEDKPPTEETHHMDIDLDDLLKTLKTKSDSEKKSFFDDLDKERASVEPKRPLYKHPIVGTAAAVIGTLVVVETGKFAAKKIFGRDAAELRSIDGGLGMTG